MSKYLFVVPSFASGGAERAVANLSSELANQGEAVTVIIYFSCVKEYPVHPDVKVINLSGGNEECYNAIGYFSKVKRLRGYIREEKPDFVFPFLPQVTIHAALACMGLKVRVIHTVRNNPAVTPENPVKRYVCNWIVRHSWKTIVQNQQQKEFYPQSCHKKLYILFNPVSPDMFRCSHVPGEDPYTVIGVGRLNTQKNFPLLIHAMEKVLEVHPEAVLRIFGEGELQETLVKQIRDRHLESKVFLMGRSSNMVQVYQSADLFILSSDFEGMPNTLIEAMAAGLPCISTDCKTGPSDLIDNGENGLLVPVGDADALAAAMVRLIDDPKLAAAFRVKAREKIRAVCSVDQIVQKLKKICLD